MSAQARSKLHASVFRRGQKAELFDDGGGETDEAAELQGKLGELLDMWALERSGRDLAAAIWRPALGLAEVVQQRGKVLTHMGFTRGAKLYLFPEEAVYLIDRANLLLFLDLGGQQKRLLSLQEAHDLLAGCGVPLERYLVFCKLLRAGYIVQRHPARWALAPREPLEGLVAGWGQERSGDAPQQVGAPPAAAAQQQQQQQPPPAGVLAAPPAKRRRVDLRPEKRSAGWWAAGPAAAGQQQQADQAQADGQPQQEVQPQQEQQAQQEPGGGGGDGGTGLPWLAGCLPPGFLEGLPRCEVLPTREQRARADFPHMAPLASVPAADLLPLSGPSGGRHLLHYDVFPANAKFSRRQPGRPAFVVSVLPCSRLPTPEDAVAADAAAGGTPVRFSTIEMGDICFYSLTHVELRSIL